MKKICATVLLVSVIFCNLAAATPIEVGSGVNIANLTINWKDGYAAEFLVRFGSESSATAVGIDLLNTITANTSLTAVLTDWGWGISVDGISFDGHSDPGYAGGEDYWHYWTKDNGETMWTSSWVGAMDRIVNNGDSDGWVYGSAGAPVPEPMTLALLGAGGLALRRKK
jgi:hypothetical protein